jgi:ADP-ribosyl-[dinitrogen reductase] hydrolase
MVGGGTFDLEPGQWTDDTSLALCLAESLIQQQGFDPRDQLERYVRWYREGHLSSTGECFDIGTTTGTALRRFESTRVPFAGPTDTCAAGNGSIMRLAPVPMFFYPDERKAIDLAAQSSRTTHGAPECVDACRLFAFMLVKALSGQQKNDVLVGRGEQLRGCLAEKIEAIACATYVNKTEDQIRGTGYVVESMEAALWCFAGTHGFRDAVLKAVNLGDDADTTGAVCGQIAGAFYGESGIPPEWLDKLCMREKITKFADQLYEAGSTTRGH